MDHCSRKDVLREIKAVKQTSRLYNLYPGGTSATLNVSYNRWVTLEFETALKDYSTLMLLRIGYVLPGWYSVHASSSLMEGVPFIIISVSGVVTQEESTIKIGGIDHQIIKYALM